MDPTSAAPAAIAASSSSPASPVSTATPEIAPLEGATDHELVFAAAQEASGRPNGGVYTKDNGVGVPYLRIRLPQYDYIVMIRDVYTEIYAWVAARLKEMRAVNVAGGSSPAVRLVLYGQPGTGKSSTLPVLQAALLEQSLPVFYHVLGSEDVYLFNDVYSRKMAFTEFASFRPARPVVCLLDTPTKPYGGQEDAMWRRPNTIFVLASSPRQTPDKTLEKAQGETHYWTMPAAGLQEVENVDLLRRHVQLTGCTYITTKTFHLHRYTPSDTCTAGHAFEAKDAYVRMTASQERVDANNAPPAQQPTAVPDEEEEEEPEGAVSISIGGDSFDVSPGPDWTPQELFELLGPSFRLAFDRTLKKGDEPKRSLRNFLKLALITNDESLEKIVTILQGARLDLREHPTGYHQIAYELPSGPQPSAGDPSIERVIPTRFLLAVVREQLQELQGAMLEAVILKMLPLPHARGLLYETRGIHCVETLESPLKVYATPSAAKPDPPAYPDLPIGLSSFLWTPAMAIPPKDGIYVSPVGYTTLDGFVVSEAQSSSPNLFLLQFTTAERHKVKPEGITGVLKNISWPNPPTVIYVFVAPDEEKGRLLAKVKYRGLKGHSIAAGTDSSDASPAKKKVKITIPCAYAVIPMSGVTSRLEQLFPRNSPQTSSISAFSPAPNTL